jgi:beta-glucanase (GH16 family)
VAVGGALTLLLAVGVGVGVVSGSDTGSKGGNDNEGSSGPPQPVGRQEGWTLAFNDEFDGVSLNLSKWIDRSSAQSDAGHGNKGNKQLEWNQAANCLVADGELAMTAKRQSFTSPAGESYDWTSCLISSTPSYSFQYGYVEERAILPAARGFWPAFWTWQAPTVEEYIETDVYEFYSDNRGQLHLTQHSGTAGGCQWKPGFDPTAGWHTYAAAIEPSGTSWFVDGSKVCSTPSTSAGVTNIISNMAVYADIPPAASTNMAVKRVDYIRAWTRR